MRYRERGECSALAALATPLKSSSYGFHPPKSEGMVSDRWGNQTQHCDFSLDTRIVTQPLVEKWKRASAVYFVLAFEQAPDAAFA